MSNLRKGVVVNLQARRKEKIGANTAPNSRVYTVRTGEGVKVVEREFLPVPNSMVFVYNCGDQEGVAGRRERTTGGLTQEKHKI